MIARARASPRRRPLARRHRVERLCRHQVPERRFPAAGRRDDQRVDLREQPAVGRLDLYSEARQHAGQRRTRPRATTASTRRAWSSLSPASCSSDSGCRTARSRRVSSPARTERCSRRAPATPRRSPPIIPPRPGFAGRATSRPACSWRQASRSQASAPSSPCRQVPAARRSPGRSGGGRSSGSVLSAAMPGRLSTTARDRTASTRPHRGRAGDSTARWTRRSATSACCRHRSRRRAGRDGDGLVPGPL